MSPVIITLKNEYNHIFYKLVTQVSRSCDNAEVCVSRLSLLIILGKLICNNLDHLLLILYALIKLFKSVLSSFLLPTPSFSGNDGLKFCQWKSNSFSHQWIKQMWGYAHWKRCLKVFLPLCVSTEKPEESQAPKPAKKKKARRETWDGVHSAGLCMQETWYSVYATPLVAGTLNKDLLDGLYLENVWKPKQLLYTSTCQQAHRWKLKLDAVQSNVMRCWWFLSMHLILIVSSNSTESNNWRSCIVVIRRVEITDHV